jgi:murein DD-endopeptidase MepM/ murein hydrolase activator NlpD
VGRRLSILGGALAVLATAAAAGAEPVAERSSASARAFAIRIVVPGQPAVVTASAAAPPDAVAYGAGFAYPEDGSVLTSGSVTASSSAVSLDASAVGNAAAEATSLTLFGGEITIAQAVGRASASAESGRASGDLSGAVVTGLVVLGQPVEATPGLRIPLADWGYAILLAKGEMPAGDGWRGFVTAVEIQLLADHGGLPAGSQIVAGYAEAVARAPARPATAPPPAKPKAAGSEQPPAKQGKKNPDAVPPLVRRSLPSLVPRLTRSGYVFPVHGPASFTDTFRAARAVVGWHHGEDIFAPIGAPVLAVAKGTVFSVGWNDIGGNRLWLRDTTGNEFYYAHLSAFSPLAINGARVEAGDVLGFVGNTGDAETTPPHLHFEIHPVGLLGLGYDGVINPYRYLLAWQRLEDVRFIAGAGWAPLVGRKTRAPQPGAYLLSSVDISSASGLAPGSLRRALTRPASAEQEAPAAGGGRVVPPASLRASLR